MECQTVSATEDQLFLASKTDAISEIEGGVYFTDKPAKHDKLEGGGGRKRTSFFLFKGLGIFSWVCTQGQIFFLREYLLQLRSWPWNTLQQQSLDQSGISHTQLAPTAPARSSCWAWLLLQGLSTNCREESKLCIWKSENVKHSLFKTFPFPFSLAEGPIRTKSKLTIFLMVQSLTVYGKRETQPCSKYCQLHRVNTPVQGALSPTNCTELL